MGVIRLPVQQIFTKTCKDETLTRGKAVPDAVPFDPKMIEEREDVGPLYGTNNRLGGWC